MLPYDMEVSSLVGSQKAVGAKALVHGKSSNMPLNSDLDPYKGSEGLDPIRKDIALKNNTNKTSYVNIVQNQTSTNKDEKSLQNRPKTTLTNLSKAQQEFKERCLDQWIKSPRKGENELDFLNIFPSDSVSDQQKKDERDRSIQQVFQKKSHETLEVQKKIIQSIKPEGEVDLKITHKDKFHLQAEKT